ncbi:hypothetical protein KIPB_015845, partial [Kipferlia bialata]
LIAAPLHQRIAQSPRLVY